MISSNEITWRTGSHRVCIRLQRKGELDWFLSVRYHCKLTGAISCSQEAYIHHLLVKYGMMSTLCKLPMNPGAGLDSLPILYNPD